MATNSFSWTDYGEIAVIDKLNGGIQLFGNGYTSPSYENTAIVGTNVKSVSPAQVIVTGFGSVTVNSYIEIYPSGLSNQGKSRRFICDATMATLATART